MIDPPPDHQGTPAEGQDHGARNDDPRLLEELAEAYEALVALILKEPSGFTPADLRYAHGADAPQKAGRKVEKKGVDCVAARG